MRERLPEELARERAADGGREDLRAVPVLVLELVEPERWVWRERSGDGGAWRSLVGVQHRSCGPFW